MTAPTFSQATDFPMPAITSFDLGLGSGVTQIELLAGLVAIASLVVIVWSLVRLTRRPRKAPNAVETLGETRIDGHAVHLLRVGQRILLIGVTGDEIRCLNEVTDPREAAMLLGSSTSHENGSAPTDITEPVLGASFAEALSITNGKPLTASSRRRLARHNRRKNYERSSRMRRQSSILCPIPERTPTGAIETRFSTAESQNETVEVPVSGPTDRSRSRILRINEVDSPFADASSAESRISRFKERIQEMRKLG